MRAILGGTFGSIHKGHIALISKAFEIADYVYIGLTTDAYVRAHGKSPRTPRYAARRRNLYRIAKKYGKKFEIRPLRDRFGPATSGEFDLIVVSEGTFKTAVEINAIRAMNNLKPLAIKKVKYVLAKDRIPISTSRIILGEIDASGNLLDRYGETISKLRKLSDRKVRKSQKRFGISQDGSLGVRIPELRRISRELGTDHSLALRLWNSGIHEARILASLIEDPSIVGKRQMELWVADLDSWDICDACCNNLFCKTPFAYGKALEWSARKEEFVKRAGFVLMACLAIHDKYADDGKFVRFLDRAARESRDGRRFVTKAVNWTIRQIGKRNKRLNGIAISIARTIGKNGNASSRWIASDALRELKSKGVQKRLQ